MMALAIAPVGARRARAQAPTARASRFVKRLAAACVAVGLLPGTLHAQSKPEFIALQGTVKAAPLQLVNGKEQLTLRFDCKPCEMHVVGAMRPNVLRQLREQPITFYRRDTLRP